MFELYLHYYPNRGRPSDIILLDTQTQHYYAWIERNIEVVGVRPTEDGKPHLTVGCWNRIKTISLGDYIRGSPLLFLILTGKDYYTTLPKGTNNAKRQ